MLGETSDKENLCWSFLLTQFAYQFLYWSTDKYFVGEPTTKKREIFLNNQKLFSCFDIKLWSIKKAKDCKQFRTKLRKKQSISMKQREGDTHEISRSTKWE